MKNQENGHYELETGEYLAVRVDRNNPEPTLNIYGPIGFRVVDQEAGLIFLDIEGRGRRTLDAENLASAVQSGTPPIVRLKP